MKWFRERRRRKILSEPFLPAWEAVLEGLPISRKLPESHHAEWRRTIQILIGEKRFEGCAGVEITDTIRVAIAAHAAILLLGRETDYFPQLGSILVYPDAYEAPSEEAIGEYLVEEGTEVREGESWYRGEMVLSWKDVRRDIRNPKGGRNVVFHEFAHQLDDESGTADGTPVLSDRELWQRWVTVFEREYDALIEADDRGRRTLIDPYGAQSPAEFFAVVTECFFTRGVRLRERHPQLYELLGAYYRQDPATW
jgi:Mlc titration factor MtfA (ptsG expression regulator)